MGARIVQPIVTASARDEATVATRLLRAVIAKSFLELLLICVIATWAAFVNYSPLLRGALDVADGKRVAGWAHDPLAPEQALEVQLFIDGQFVAARRANEPRADLVAAGATTQPQHGFTFDLTKMQLTQGQHTAQIYAVRAAAGANKALVPIAKQPRVFVINH